MAVARGWRVLNPNGRAVVSIDGGSREDALRAAFAPVHNMPDAVYRTLCNLNDRCAGWAAIDSRGWRVEPIKGP